MHFENKREHLLKDIRFYLKMEHSERGGKIAPFLSLGVKRDLNENGLRKRKRVNGA